MIPIIKPSNGRLCLSDGRRIRTFDRLLRRQVLYPAELCHHFPWENSYEILGISPFFKSGWQDSNLRPPRPKRGAITGLRYTPRPCNKVSNFQKKSGETGTRTLATVTRRQISNLLRYHSGTSPNTKCI